MIDGNKQLGVSLLGILCKLNNIELVYSQKELVELGLGIAQNKLKKEDIENWIIEHVCKRNL
ncbi:hypothetical protein [Caloramator mitchellensis]|uniref:hypothetical protein n=1 Tax=Caloramator mitchellensis TaxID=908809 RepID=UPI003119174E